LIQRPTRLLPLEELSVGASVVVVVLQEPGARAFSSRGGGGAEVLPPLETEVDQFDEASAVRLGVGAGGAVTVLAKPGPELLGAVLEGPASAARTSVEKAAI
jgi:hypothetical protein